MNNTPKTQELLSSTSASILLILCLVATILYGVWYQSRQRSSLSEAEFFDVSTTRAERVAEKILKQLRLASSKEFATFESKKAAALFEASGRYALVFVPDEQHSGALLFLAGFGICDTSQAAPTSISAYVETYFRNFSFTAYYIRLAADGGMVSSLRSSRNSAETKLPVFSMRLSEISYDSFKQEAFIPLAENRVLLVPLCEASPVSAPQAAAQP